MKKVFILGAFAFLLSMAMPMTASAKSYEIKGGTHFKKNPPYNCSITKKPAKPEWVWYRYPTKKHPKRDAYNNKKVHLIWEDSDRAHEVEIRYWAPGVKKKTITTEDNAEHSLKKLKNGKVYTVKVRGISNCGTGSWSDEVKVKP